MHKRMVHYFKRSRELGLRGTVQRIWIRTGKSLGLSLRSLWWGFLARKKMSNSSFLTQTTGNWRTVEDLLSHLASRTASSFVLPHEYAEETTRLLGQHYPEYLDELFATADAITENKIDLLGHTFEYLTGIDWQRDPVTGWRWPLLYREKMKKFVGADRPVDLIIFWELNRHQHFITLGIAYWLTGDKRYLNTFINQIQNWINTNPLRQGINWYYPLEISIRIIAWTTAFQFFRASPEFQQEVGEIFIKSLWQQTNFLNRHLQTVRTADDVPNNHMIAELTGIIVVGTAFPEFRAAADWREKGLHLLIDQANAQTHTDGVHKEQASGYHRFVTELLLLVVVNNPSVLKHEPVLKKTLERMLDHILFSTTPAGTNPMWGDTDFGRALGLGLTKDFWDFRPLLSTGAVLFRPPKWKFAAGDFDIEAFWLLGTNGLRDWEEIDEELPKETSRAFPQAGQYIIRDSWSKNTDVAFFRCGVFGLGGEGHCAHAHSDLLSFVLWVNGQPVLVDSGTYKYHGSLRDYFRLTSAHNAVIVDGQDQAIPQPNFNWREISNAKNIDWSENNVIGALHYPDVEFTRNLSHPRPGVWNLNDKFRGTSTHMITWFFNFAPGFAFDFLQDDQILRLSKGGQPFLNLHIPSSNGMNMQLDDAWYAYKYAMKEKTQKLHAEWQGELNEQGANFNWRFELVASEKGEGDAFN